MSAGLEQVPVSPRESHVSAPASADFYYGKHNRLARVIEVPTDANGIPLTIIPSKKLASLDIHDPRLNKHHELFLFGPQTFKELGSRAMRQSRILRTEKVIHNHGTKGFHRFFTHSRGPLDEQGQFNFSLLSLAGYLPTRGIDLWSGEPIERDIEPDELEILSIPHKDDPNMYRNHFYHIEPVRKFYEKFVKSQDITIAEPATIERFMASSKIGETRDYGYEILHTAIGAAVSPVEESYRAAREKGQLHPNAPIDPGEIVLRALGDKDRHGVVMHAMWMRLAREAEFPRDGQTGADELKWVA